MGLGSYGAATVGNCSLLLKLAPSPYSFALHQDPAEEVQVDALASEVVQVVEAAFAFAWNFGAAFGRDLLGNAPPLPG